MEATGIYSMPVYHALIEHGGFEQVLVCNAGHVKNVPGRKTDLSDAEWLVHLLECGLLRGSFIPPVEIKAARDVIRYRTKLTESRTSELQRLGNVLQDAGIKIDSVASTITTMLGAGDGGGPHRRGTSPEDAGRSGQGQDAHENSGSGAGAGRPLRRPSCADVSAAPGSPRSSRRR